MRTSVPLAGETIFNGSHEPWSSFARGYARRGCLRATFLSRIEVALNLTTRFGDLDLSFVPSGTSGFEDLHRPSGAAPVVASVEGEGRRPVREREGYGVSKVTRSEPTTSRRSCASAARFPRARVRARVRRRGRTSP